MGSRQLRTPAETHKGVCIRCRRPSLRGRTVTPPAPTCPALERSALPWTWLGRNLNASSAAWRGFCIAWLEGAEPPWALEARIHMPRKWMCFC